MPLRWVFFLGLLGIGWFAPSRIPNMDRGVAVGIFLVYSAMMGAFISWTHGGGGRTCGQSGTARRRSAAIVGHSALIGLFLSLLRLFGSSRD
ncbi:MAG: hypothetical protein U0168_10835 [Nannocystaceae bacterium]